jgi:phage tail-like protein
MKASSASSKRASVAVSALSAEPARPYTGLRFAVSIQDMRRTGAVEVVLPAARIVEVPRRARSVQFEPLVIRRGLTASTEWFDWWEQARRPRARSRLVTVALLEASGTEAVRWLFRDCAPVGYALSPLNALVASTVIESLELRVGDFELYRRQ